MNYREFEEIAKIIRTIPDEKNKDKAFQMLMKASDNSCISSGKNGSTSDTEKDETSQTILLKFTKKEISRIPMRFRKEFLIEGRVIHCYRRKSGKNTTNYMLRYRRNGVYICVTSNNLEEARKKFIEAMNAVARGETLQKGKDDNKIPTNFHDFTMYYFENYRKRKVSEKTFENDGYRYKNHLQPQFGSMELKDITPSQCQKFLDKYEEKGQTKTNRELYSMLNGIFKMAIAHNIIQSNPLAVVIQATHKSKHGKALTKAEERILLEKSAGTRYQKIFALSLYTGLRPNEIYTAQIEKDFILARNSKRKGGKIEYKKIPISTMLKPYLEGVDKLDIPTLEYIRATFNKILPDHIYYDLRTTFYTRCEECGVAEPARDHFVGHSRGELNNTYSDLSDEYLLKEGAKLVW